MTAIHGSYARLLANGYDLSPFMREATSSRTADTAEASTWAMPDGSQRSDKGYVPGMIGGAFSGGAILDLAGGLDPVDAASIFELALSGDVLMVHMPNQGAFGSRAMLMRALGSGVEITTPHSDVAAATLTAQSTESRPGVVLKGHADVISATGNGTTYDSGASSLNGGVGMLQVPVKGGGAGTFTVKIQHSVDGTVWVDLITFAGVTVAHGSERIAVTGTVNRYLRAIWTVTGGTWQGHVSFARG